MILSTDGVSSFATLLINSTDTIRTLSWIELNAGDMVRKAVVDLHSRAGWQMWIRNESSVLRIDGMKEGSLPVKICLYIKYIKLIDSPCYMCM